jgi:hypothetical protein
VARAAAGTTGAGGFAASLENNHRKDAKDAKARKEINAARTWNHSFSTASALWVSVLGITVPFVLVNAFNRDMKCQPELGVAPF